MTRSLLPPNASPLERALEAAMSKRLNDIPHLIRTTDKATAIPAVWLPWLAWARRVETWDSDWPDITKRAAINAAFAVHRRKGTIGAMRRALAALDVVINVVEWFEETPARAPYTFRVTLTPLSGGVSSDLMVSLLSIIENTKNARSHLSEVQTIDAHSSTNFYGGVNFYTLTMRIPIKPT